MPENSLIMTMEIPDIKEIEQRLGVMKSKANIVMARGINRTITHVSAKIAKSTGEKFKVKNLSSKDIKRTLHLKKASSSETQGEVRLYSKEKLELIRFQVNPAKATKRIRANPPQFYESQILKNGSMKPLTGKSGERSKAFVAKMPNKHVGVFERVLSGKTKKNTSRTNGRNAGKFKGLKDDPIAQLYGPTIASMVASKIVSKGVVEDGTKFLEKQINHDIKHFMEALK